MSNTAYMIMTFGFWEIFVTLLNFLLTLSIPILLEVFLATRQNKWLGLILPILSALSTLAIFVLLLLNLVGGTNLTPILLLFGALALIPAAVLFLTYALCRRWLARKTAADEMTQMNIQDL